MQPYMYGNPDQPVSGPWGQPAGPPTPGGLVPATAVPAPAPYGSEPVLIRIGQIEVTATTVHTPAGSFPVRGSTWHMMDRMYPVQKTPTWAIVLAIVGFFCLTIFSLLFLIAKETRYEGWIEVNVSNGPYQFTTQLPGLGPGAGQAVQAQINYVRSLAMR